jgi:hypothetical protein
VKGIFEVPFERPRPGELRYEPEHAALAARIRRAVDERSPEWEPALAG